MLCDLFPVPCSFWRVVCATVGFAACSPAAQITLTQVAVDRDRLRKGESFGLTATAEGRGVDVLSFRLRTPYAAGPGDVPPGFTVERGRGHAALAVAGSGHIPGISVPGAVSRDGVRKRAEFTIGTAGLRPGLHYLVLFAHNRPGTAPHVKDFRNIELRVAGDEVSVRVLDQAVRPGGPPVVFSLPEQINRAGGVTLTCGVRARDPAVASLAAKLHPPYTWGPDEALPGFRYYPAERLGFVEDTADHIVRDNGPNDADPSDGSIRLDVPMTGWPAGVHVLTLEAECAGLRAPYGSGEGAQYRDFCVRVPAETDQFDVTVHPSVEVGTGTHFSNLIHVGDGRVVTDTHWSEDRGATWHALPTAIPRPNVLPDGTVAGTTYRAYPVQGKPGEYRGELWLSDDGCRTVRGPIGASVTVPLARAALGHGKHVGPLFGRSIVVLDNGEWLSSMYGWFHGDAEPDHYRKGGTMRRSYIGRSTDQGRSWDYLSTVAYRPFLGNEGYSELVIRRLPNGDVLALVRTGGNSKGTWQDNPLMMSRSRDGGRTWSPVKRTGVEGVWPDLCVLSDGVLVCSTGRPGAFIMFSTDNGETWTDHTPIDGERYSGYTAVCELAPGELLVGYGVKNGLDPDTGRRRDMLRVARVSFHGLRD